MDPKRFDRWTRRLHSRRAVGRTLVGLGVGLTVAPSTSAASTAVKPGKRRRFGCTKPANVCMGAASFPCPASPGGALGFCVRDNQGRPFCVSGGRCAPCKTNRDCAAAFPGAICIKCAECQPNDGLKTACLAPLTDA